MSWKRSQSFENLMGVAGVPPGTRPPDGTGLKRVRSGGRHRLACTVLCSDIYVTRSAGERAAGSPAHADPPAHHRDAHLAHGGRVGAVGAG